MASSPSCAVNEHTGRIIVADDDVLLREGLASRLGAMRFRLYGLAQLADALTRKGEHSAALGAAREGLETEERTGHRQWEAEGRGTRQLAPTQRRLPPKRKKEKDK